MFSFEGKKLSTPLGLTVFSLEGDSGSFWGLIFLKVGASFLLWRGFLSFRKGKGTKIDLFFDFSKRGAYFYSFLGGRLIGVNRLMSMTFPRHFGVKN